MGTATSATDKTVVSRGERLSRPAAPLPSAARNQLSARQPLLYTALAYAGGLWAGKYIWRPPSWWAVAAIVFVCGAIYMVRRRAVAASALALGAVFAAGALTIQVHGSYSEKTPRFGNGEEVEVSAHVIAEGDLQQDTAESWHQRIDIETEKLEVDLQSWETRAGVRLNIYSQEKPDSLARTSCRNGATDSASNSRPG